MAHANLGAIAPSFQPRVAASTNFPDDYYDLVRELSAAETPEQLRQWSFGSTARRAALPREAQHQLRNLTLGQMAIVRGARFGNAAPVIAERDADHIGTVVRRLLDVLSASAEILTPLEAREFADAIRNAGSFLMPETFEGEVA